MISRMPPQAYIDQHWFERERELFFKPLWQFVGLKMMLSRHNAFITRTLCGIPIVVQNFDGELRAFENLCAHRQNPVQTQPHGVRPLVCSYHGWGYGQNGNAENIPFEAEVYRYPQDERVCLKLRRFALATIGNLVFVNLSAEPRPIDQQFSADMIESLRECSEAFDSEVMLTTFETRCNWKLMYENLRDAHHPRYLHARSLYEKVKFPVRIDEAGVAAAKNPREAGAGSHAEAMAIMRSFSNGGLDAPMEEMAPFAWHDNVDRYGDKDWYYNWLVFPNLHIASGSGGYSFIIEHHIPVSANRTDLIVHYVTAKKKRRYASSAAVLHAHMMGAEGVLREDINVMENIQKNLHPDAPCASLGDFEFFNASIERWYLDVMESKIAL
jgi:phenylpropionate dioxygenase-like ring-hydroxylating dioxygenase large terminal subunit